MKSPRIMYAYAGFLIACGIVAYFMAPPDANATTALIIPAASGVLMVICAVMAGMLHRKRAVGMIGIHAGLVLPLLFAIAFGVRAYGAFGAGEDKRYLAVILSILTVASIITFIAILVTRPKPEART